MNSSTDDSTNGMAYFFSLACSAGTMNRHSCHMMTGQGEDDAAVGADGEPGGEALERADELQLAAVELGLAARTGRCTARAGS